ncbi:hypothetical protein Desaci_0337 [Desulfosporosinus acidiphilus SJ4]|uniref:Uncharacterized protein n=1 Tax=Desulfosporosinus acidiphilus (strain DSM 22704 / JCM 16185 / SJ4) TaxID=646529 RepID=I4D0T5_DESAJ|nr:hypothetical protein [Desulfosporosinus acidiphilus]AFM39409.1 hypothetical protein Desaci_0337 [Desulfosporosinus acidiphilus SJ4]
MMKTNKAMPWWGWLTWVLAIILGLIAYSHLPAQVIGKANRMTPRLLIVLYEPAIMLFIILLWHVLWRIDPKKKNYETFWPTYRYIGGVIVVCISLVYLTVIGHALNIASMRLVPTVIGIMFMLIANMLPRIPQFWSECKENGIVAKICSVDPNQPLLGIGIDFEHAGTPELEVYPLGDGSSEDYLIYDLAYIFK